jgi:predicted metal-binding membrane protein
VDARAQPAASPLAAISARDRIVIVGCILAIAALAWALLVHLNAGMAPMTVEGMEMPMDMPGTTSFLFLFGMWGGMMIGMMAGPATPMLLLFAGAHATRQPGRLPLATILFGLGYAIAWIVFSAGAALAQWALHRAAMLSPAMTAAMPWLGGAVLIVAGVYQLTPVKRMCLDHCRSPLGFLMTHWRNGALGAAEMGLRHGAYCVGCCWALMLVLFAVGVMNLLWVAVLMLFVLIEKVGPGGIVVSRIAGVAMVAAGIAVMAGVL